MYFTFKTAPSNYVLLVYKKVIWNTSPTNISMMAFQGNHELFNSKWLMHVSIWRQRDTTFSSAAKNVANEWE